ncbi:GRAM domain-containing protein 2A [Trichinella spiralis]|uniref:GRAM domain-containing protein 2A n=1 Tax=Trichinella spiralis TaxID=6334 RepID=A0ABR3KP25_TRISP
MLMVMVGANQKPLYKANMIFNGNMSKGFTSKKFPKWQNVITPSNIEYTPNMQNIPYENALLRLCNCTPEKEKKHEHCVCLFAS